MKKLLSQYGFKSDMQYFEMIVESYLNGQKQQAKQQFLAMNKINRKLFVNALIEGTWESGLQNTDLFMFVNSI